MPADRYLQELTALAGIVLTHDDIQTAMVEICRVATRAVPGADGASLTSYREGAPAATASDEWSAALDELQYAEHEGPCLDALRTGTIYRVRDLADDLRWPSYLPRAVAAGARSMVSVPTSAEGRLIGALDLYSRTVDAFDAEAVSIAEVVAAHAGLAGQVSAAFFRHRDLAAQLSEAMRSRAVIEQAKGVVMATRHCPADAAFETLVALSQRSNRKLRDVAEAIVADVVGHAEDAAR